MNACREMTRHLIECLHIDCLEIWSTAIPHDKTSHDTRRAAERSAVATLIRAAFGPEAHIEHNDSGVPYLTVASSNHTISSISISHCSDTAMLAIAPEGYTIGIDCEHFRAALRNVAPRVLSSEELAEWGSSDSLLLRAWTIKEAVYKAALTPGLPFAEGIILPHPDAMQIPETALAQTSDGRQFKLLPLHIHPCTTIALALPELSGHELSAQ